MAEFAQQMRAVLAMRHVRWCAAGTSALLAGALAGGHGSATAIVTATVGRRRRGGTTGGKFEARASSANPV